MSNNMNVKSWIELSRIIENDLNPTFESYIKLNSLSTNDDFTKFYKKIVVVNFYITCYFYCHQGLSLSTFKKINGKTYKIFSDISSKIKKSGIGTIRSKKIAHNIIKQKVKNIPSNSDIYHLRDMIIRMCEEVDRHYSLPSRQYSLSNSHVGTNELLDILENNKKVKNIRKETINKGKLVNGKYQAKIEVDIQSGKITII